MASQSRELPLRWTPQIAYDFLIVISPAMPSGHQEPERPEAAGPGLGRSWRLPFSLPHRHVSGARKLETDALEVRTFSGKPLPD